MSFADKRPNFKLSTRGLLLETSRRFVDSPNIEYQCTLSPLPAPHWLCQLSTCPRTGAVLWSSRSPCSGTGQLDYANTQIMGSLGLNFKCPVWTLALLYFIDTLLAEDGGHSHYFHRIIVAVRDGFIPTLPQLLVTVRGQRVSVGD